MYASPHMFVKKQYRLFHALHRKKSGLTFVFKTDELLKTSINFFNSCQPVKALST